MKIKRLIVGIFLGSVAIAAVSGAAFWHFYKNFAHTSTLHKTMILTVLPGTSVRNISHQLRQAEAISSPFLFEAMVRIHQAETRLQAGEYELASELTPLDIMHKMVTGDVRRFKFTIPEGLTLAQIEERLERETPFRNQKFLTLTTDLDLIKNLGLEDTASLEGYLFPSTYIYNSATTLEEMIVMMVTAGKKIWTSERTPKALALGLSRQQVLTLASIVEKESGISPERPLVASVFFNRLAQGMPLQSDPTVAYGLKDLAGPLTTQNLKTDHPYNTYTRNGLPPGPICSPGLAAIDAVLNPATSDYFYFVANNDGTHQFSRTLAEHNQAVSEYRKKLKGTSKPYMPQP